MLERNKMNICTVLRVRGVLRLKKSVKLMRCFSYDYHDESGDLRLPKKAKVVICGGGVMGASVAYHLAELGWGSQTIVLEQGKYVESNDRCVQCYVVEIVVMSCFLQTWRWNDLEFVWIGEYVQIFVPSSENLSSYV